MSGYLSTVYDSDVSKFLAVKEPKYCEMCGKAFCRLVGSTDQYCVTCHANWNERLDTSLLPRIELESDFQPEVVVAPKHSCRIKKPMAPILKKQVAPKKLSIVQRIKQQVWASANISAYVK